MSGWPRNRLVVRFSQQHGFRPCQACGGLYWVLVLLACVIAGSASFAVNSVVVSKRENPPVIAADIEQAAAAVLEVRHRVLRAFRVLQASSERATCALRVVSRTSLVGGPHRLETNPEAITRKAALSDPPAPSLSIGRQLPLPTSSSVWA
jgi:hypothetical protein